MINLPVITGFTGYLQKTFNSKSLNQYIFSRRLVPQKQKVKCTYTPIRCVRLLKVHGSINWSLKEGLAIEHPIWKPCGQSAVVIPGSFKYKDSIVESLFDNIRKMANDSMEKCRALMTYGFGFNDDHIQRVAQERIANGMPAIIISKTWTPKIKEILESNPHVVGICEHGTGARYQWRGQKGQCGDPIWKLDCLMKVALE